MIIPKIDGWKGERAVGERTAEGLCYIVGAGERTGDTLIPVPGDLVIAADGGLEWLDNMGLAPDLVVGDFDSLGGPPVGDHVVVLPQEKDDTDTMAAVRLAEAQGYRRFAVYGGTGGRFDHTLANLQLLTWLSRRGYENRLYAPDWVAAAVTDGALVFPAGGAGTVSVFCQGDRAQGVTLEGLKYPLHDAALTCEFALGVSNSFTGRPARVAVEKGTLLVVWARANA